MRMLYFLRRHDRQCLSPPGIPDIQGVAVLQGDCELGVYHHFHRNCDAPSFLSSDSRMKKRWHRAERNIAMEVLRISHGTRNKQFPGRNRVR
jgi:hypothetical protein